MDIIKTKEFTLRPYTMADAKNIAPLLNNWNVVKNLSQLPFPYEKKHAQQFISKVLLGMKRKEPKDYAMAIEIDGKVAGSIGLHSIIAGHKGELGYWLAESFWGRGIMTKVVKKFITYSFLEFKLKRIFSRVYESNEASMRVLEKVGMRFEGIQRKDAFKDGKFIDVHVWAKIK